VNPCFVKLAAQELKGTSVKICTVIGFPLGANTIPVKVLESKQAALDGANEVDIVVNIGALLEGDTQYLVNEIDRVIEAARDVHMDISAKAILETGYLTRDQMILGCWVATGAGAGADYVKTSTGFGPTGATIEDVRFLRQSVGAHLGVKAAGGIRDLATALAMVEAGADRLGTSAGVQIIEEMKKNT
jgi:deoxyribose-phosphate aldolase